MGVYSISAKVLVLAVMVGEVILLKLGMLMFTVLEGAVLWIRETSSETQATPSSLNIQLFEVSADTYITWL
jgi:hypothetical protein